MALHLDF